MRITRWSAGLVGVSTILVWMLTGPVGAQNAETGEEIYTATCSGCHGVDGSGVAGNFPPLADNPRATDAGYVSEVITNGLSGPIEVGGVLYDGEMPAFANLSESDIADVAAFLGTNFQSQDGATTTTTTPLQPAGPGDADRGEDLFLGSNRLDAGGPACAACHTAGSRGNLGGQSMGPDLTGVLNRFGGEAGLTATLSAPAFPVMQELYAGKPFTEQEKADLVAFFARETTQEDADVGDALFVMGLVGAAVLFGGMFIIKPFEGAGYARRLRRNA